MITKDWRT